MQINLSYVLAAILIIGTLMSILFLSRNKRLQRLAKKYSLSYEKGDYKVDDIKRLNFIKGNINACEIYFYDEQREIHLGQEIRDRIDELANVSEDKKDVYQKLVTTQSFLARGTAMRQIQPEMISYLQIGKKAKKIGYRYGTANIVDKSDMYISVPLLNKIINEVKESGVSQTFDLLYTGDKNKFYSGTMPYVQEVINQV